MDVFFVVLLLIIIFSSKFCKKEFNVNFLDHKQTLCINGIFVVLVLLRHSTDYCNFSENSSLMFNFINGGLKQLIVTTFLFYSGYGIYESIKNKENYVDKKLNERIKKLYLNFLIAVVSFVIMNILLNIKYDIKTIIASFFAWETIGNSNWYIFAIISMYLLTYACFKIFKNDKQAIIAITLFINLYTIIISIFKEYYWYNTVICFALGLWFSYYKKDITKFLTKNNFIYTFCFITVSLYFYTFDKLQSINTVFYECWALSFVLLVLILSLKFKIYSKTLLSLGKHTFWIYILQRMPMIILENFHINDYNNYLFVALAVFFTIIMAVIYNGVFEKKMLFGWINKVLKTNKIKLNEASLVQQ